MCILRLLSIIFTSIAIIITGSHIVFVESTLGYRASFFVFIILLVYSVVKFFECYEKELENYN